MDFKITNVYKESNESRKHYYAKFDLFKHYSDKGKYDVYMEYPFFHNELIDNYTPIDEQIEYCKTHKKLKFKHHKLAGHDDNCDIEPIGINGTTFTNENMPTFSDYTLALHMAPKVIVDVVIKNNETNNMRGIEVTCSSYMGDDKIDYLWGYTPINHLVQITANCVLNRPFYKDFSDLKDTQFDVFKRRQRRLAYIEEAVRKEEEREKLMMGALEPLVSVDIDSIDNNFK
jgi:hypothetical protein